MPTQLRRLRAPGYLLFFLGSLFPITDLIMAAFPPQFGNVAWRFGTAGVLSSAIITPLLLLFFVFTMAVLFEDRKVALTIGVLAAIGTLLLLLTAGGFALDTLQMRSRVNPAASAKFLAASGQALIKLLLETVAAAILAISAFRASRAERAKMVRNERSVGVVIGKTPAPAPAAPRPSTGALPAQSAPAPLPSVGREPNR